MNTVDALNALGKALCGDSFEVKPGLTDAETILEIAKNYTGDSGSGGGSSFTPRIIDFTQSGGATTIEYEAGLTAEDFISAVVKHTFPNPSDPTSPPSMVPGLLQIISIVDLGETIALVVNDIATGEGSTMAIIYNPETGVMTLV